MTLPHPDFSIVICAYTEDRWQELLEAIESVKSQSLAPREIIVVIDHNPALFERVTRSVEGVVVIENRQARGLSGARNSGIAAAQGDVIAFMDEDAIAAPDCLAHLSQGFSDVRVLGVGGASFPVWSNSKPGWLPEEFYWVVGCSYKGIAESTQVVRNLIGCNMAFRRTVFDEIGGFRIGIGRIGTNPVGCEETELCIRAGQHWKNGFFLFEPSAYVYHRVTETRTHYRYFLQRCFAEGLSKALVARIVGAGDGLASERQYTFVTLPKGVLQGIRETFLQRDLSGLARSFTILVGLAATTAGYLRGRLLARGNSIEANPVPRPLPLRSQPK